MLALQYARMMEAPGNGSYRWRCVLCRTEEPDLLRHRCRRCGGALDAIHDLSAVTVSADPDPLRRYFGLLPFREQATAQWLGEGNTGCVHAERLGRHLGMEALFVKDETVNPTRSTKDRMASVALARFGELGIRRLALASTGNSSTAYARAALLLGGFELHVFVGRRFLHRLNYGDHPSVRTYVVGADFGHAGTAAKRFAESRGVTFEGGFFNPGRREGLKLAYLEAFDQLPVAPRYVVQAVSSGMGLLGAYKGALEYRALGRLPMLPAFVAAQQSSCAPMAAAFAEGAPAIERRHIVPDPRGVAEAILRGDPTQVYPYVNAVCRGTGGHIISSSAEEIRSAQRLLADLEGLRVCYSSATALAGLIALRRSGDVPGDAPVLVNLTGADRPFAPVPKDVVETTTDVSGESAASGETAPGGVRPAEPERVR